MGWSCTARQNETLLRLMQAQRTQEGYGREDGHSFYIIESPMNGKDYGTPGAEVMCLSLYWVGEDRRGSRVGHVRVEPDGSFTMPRGVRTVLGL